jgi:uncharacterized protein YbaP (TraB family)
MISHGRHVMTVRCKWLTVCIFVFACCLTPAMAYTGQDSRIFLWSVISEKNTVYLLGSVHVLKKDAYPLDKRIEEAYDDAETIMFEADMTEVTKPATRMKMIASGTYQDGSTLEQHISDETYEMLKEKVAGQGMGIDRFDHLKPWLSAVTLSSLELRRMGFDPAFGIDAYFFTRARSDNKGLLFLESSDYQIELIASIPDDKSEDLLKQTIAELEVIGARSEDILSAWIKGDAQMMDAIVSMSLKEYPYIRGRLFIQRNTDWTGKIEKLIGNEKNVLVIVGAGHLVGEDGVLDRLKKKGYSVVQQ